MLTVLLFAVTHDACRISDDEDPEHGRRAARSLGLLLGERAFELGPRRRRLLVEACTHHADGLTTTDPTIGACWDADRLCLWRGDMAPCPGLMSTAPGKSAEFIHWAQDLHLRALCWTDVAAVLPEESASGLQGLARGISS